MKSSRLDCSLTSSTAHIGGLLDSRNDGLTTSRFVVCEMETLLSGSYGEATVMAVLLYLFRRMERRWTAVRRSFHRRSLAFPEASGMAGQDSGLAQDTAQEKRRASACDAEHGGCEGVADCIGDLAEHCDEDLLPNSEAGNEGMRQFYEYAGLNSREIELLQTATPKRDYYIVQRLGRRMISFRLGPVALAFLASPAKRIGHESTPWLRNSARDGSPSG